MHIFYYALLNSGGMQLERVGSMRSLCRGELASRCECTCEFFLLTCFQAKLFHPKNLKPREASEPAWGQLFWEGNITFLVTKFFKNFDRHHIELLAEAAHLQLDLVSRDMQRAGLLPNASDTASRKPGPKVQCPQLVSAISNIRQSCAKTRHGSYSFNSLLFCCAESRWYHSPSPLLYLLQRNKVSFPRAAGVRLSWNLWQGPYFLVAL